MSKLQDLRAMAKVVPDEYNLWAVPAGIRGERNWNTLIVPLRQADDIWKGVTPHDYILCAKEDDSKNLIVVGELVVYTEEEDYLCVYRYGEVIWENVKALRGDK